VLTKLSGIFEDDFFHAGGDEQARRVLGCL
jgi:hypothetical protein